ncbi:MAG: precorrin-8X methylmutase [Lachnospiraceae bacterium]|nr:precorrin-8X methylmutase [Lachnospiraceae bacterium]
MDYLNMIERLLPKDIEKRSFQIIEEELIKQNIVIPEENSAVIKRAIHTSADFDYASTLKFSDSAVEKLKDLIRSGADIVTDTNMAMAGINKRVLSGFGGATHCFMADEDVAKEAEERGLTRAYVSMEKAAEIDKPLIFAIGNAPTALVALYELYKENRIHPAFIIGVPVGFVNVEVSKKLIMETDIPYIVNEGRKGGSNVAAAICNAVLYQI